MEPLFEIRSRTLSVSLNRLVLIFSEWICAQPMQYLEKETGLCRNWPIKSINLEGALWFSRYPIPYLQHYEKGQRFRQFPFLEHIGIYFFRKKALMQFADWSRSDLEKAESLEQLRILTNGKKIMTYKTRMKTVSIDSPVDLKRIKSLL